MSFADPPDSDIRRYELLPYGRRHGNSGVIAYALGPDYLAVQFNSGETYLYTAQTAGPAHLAAMKKCAEAGAGLSGYISRHSDIRYERTLHPVGRNVVEG